jgi:Na+/proline symporter
MRADRLRLYLILVLVVAAVVSVVANKSRSAFVGWISFVVFVGALLLYITWRRTAIKERRARVFAREAKTTDDEDRTRTDQ